MDENKFADLQQGLEESEKQLYEKIAEECAANFRIAILDSVKTIKHNADAMTEVVDKVQSCNESYAEATNIVGKLSDTLTDADKEVTGINDELKKLNEMTSNSTGNLSEKVSKLLEVSDDAISQTDKFSILLLQSSKEITGLIDSQQKWKISCEEAFKEILKSSEALTANVNENRKLICSGNESIGEYEKTIHFCVDDIKRCTDEYAKCVKGANASLAESFAIFKNDLLIARNEQIHLISEIKEEQLRQKKMYMIGMIPTIVIIILQIINILK